MAKKLAQQKRVAYLCPPASCPHPPEYAGLGSYIHQAVRTTYVHRMVAARNGSARAARAAAKSRWPGVRRAAINKGKKQGK